MARSPLLLGATGEREHATRMGILRITVGAPLLLAPGIARRIYGVPAEQDSPAIRMLGRLFGIRNVVIGLWTLAARDLGEEQRRTWYQLNVAIDAIDVLALAWGAVTGEGLVRAAITAGALGTSAALGWIDLLDDLDESSAAG